MIRTVLRKEVAKVLSDELGRPVSFSGPMVSRIVEIADQHASDTLKLGRRINKFRATSGPDEIERNL